MTSDNTINNNPKSIKDIYLPFDNDDIISQVLLQSIDPMLSKIKEHVIDFILSMYHQKVYKDEYLPLKIAADLYGINPRTLHNWIYKGLISKYIISKTLESGKNINIVVVSMSEIRKIVSNLIESNRNNENKKIKSIVKSIKNR